ncbi:hypothetical protein OSTOST_15680 [Ostertagia ostertagi]
MDSTDYSATTSRRRCAVEADADGIGEDRRPAGRLLRPPLGPTASQPDAAFVVLCQYSALVNKRGLGHFAANCPSPRRHGPPAPQAPSRGRLRVSPMDAPSVRSSMPADKPSVPSSTAAPEGSVPLSDLRASAQPTNPSTGINEGITTGDTDTPSSVSVPPTSPVRASAQPIYLSTTNIPSSGTHIASPGDSSDVTAADPAPDLGRLSLRPQTVHSSPEPVVQHPSRSEPSRVRSHEEAFSRFRDATSAASSAVSSKRVRADVNVPTAPRGIQIHPAHSPEWEDTPRGYTNEFAHLHPWGRFVEPRPPVPAITEESVTKYSRDRTPLFHSSPPIPGQRHTSLSEQ